MPDTRVVLKNGRYVGELVYDDKLDSPGYQPYLNKLKRKETRSFNRGMLRDIAADHEESDSDRTDPFGYDVDDVRLGNGGLDYES